MEGVAGERGGSTYHRYVRCKSIRPGRTSVVPDVDLLQEVLAVGVAVGVYDEGGGAAGEREGEGCGDG